MYTFTSKLFIKIVNTMFVINFWDKFRFDPFIETIIPIYTLKPGMIFDLVRSFHTQSIVGIFDQKLLIKIIMMKFELKWFYYRLNQVFSILRYDTAFWPNDFTFFDHFKHSFLVLTIEWWYSNHHFIPIQKYI